MVSIDVEFTGEAIAPVESSWSAVVAVVRRFFPLVLAGLRVYDREWFQSHPTALLRRFSSPAASTLPLPVPSKRRASALSKTRRIDVESPGLSFPTVKSASRARSSPSKLTPSSHRPPNFVINFPRGTGLTSKPLRMTPPRHSTHIPSGPSFRLNKAPRPSQRPSESTWNHRRFRFRSSIWPKVGFFLS